ncbi:MAG TPA: formylglycine-generating enzyme family protein [Verrucomicrobiota bacterium]|nr:formylglycine-generating enzyme family protein [Verrucomicrobiota bacterium]HQL80437.1 formylglycine-generating enzyme family protein [Verrucomicrobiota bacterium]
MRSNVRRISLGLYGLALWAVAATPAAADQVTDIAMVPRLTIQGTIVVPRLTIQGTMGVTHQIQYTNQLRQGSWAVLTNVVVTGSPYYFMDMTVPPAPQRFYRVVPLAPPPLITNLTVVGGVAQFSVQSALGVINQIQCCTNLGQAEWQVLTSLVVSESPYRYVDAGAAGVSPRFYRVAAFYRVVPLATPLLIINLTVVGGVAQFSVQSELGITNQIQCCTNLGQAKWQVLTNLVVSESPYRYVDAGAAGVSPRFYRVAALAGGAPPPAGMVLIRAGSSTMGNCMDPAEGWSDELPLHTVYVSGFYLDRYEVTKALWDEVKGWNGGNGYVYENSGAGKAANHPVQEVNWRDCVKWCNARSQKEGLVPCYYNEAGLTTVYKSGTGTPYPKWDANGYRLPTEAEWEKAARGGASGHRFPWSDTDNITHSRANYWAGYSYPYDLSYPAGFHPTFAAGGYPYTSPVGSFGTNGYGLYDMTGNVWEWCWDWWSDGYYSSSPGTDPRGPTSGSYRVVRGGGWHSYAGNCRSARRGSDSPGIRDAYLGFRSVRAPGQ